MLYGLKDVHILTIALIVRIGIADSSDVPKLIDRYVSCNLVLMKICASCCVFDREVTRQLFWI